MDIDFTDFSFVISALALSSSAASSVVSIPMVTEAFYDGTELTETSADRRIPFAESTALTIFVGTLRSFKEIVLQVRDPPFHTNTLCEIYASGAIEFLMHRRSLEGFRHSDPQKALDFLDHPPTVADYSTNPSHGLFPPS